MKITTVASAAGVIKSHKSTVQGTFLFLGSGAIALIFKECFAQWFQTRTHISNYMFVDSKFHVQVKFVGVFDVRFSSIWAYLKHEKSDFAMLALGARINSHKVIILGEKMAWDSHVDYLMPQHLQLSRTTANRRIMFQSSH